MQLNRPVLKALPVFPLSGPQGRQPAGREGQRIALSARDRVNEDRSCTRHKATLTYLQVPLPDRFLQM